ncbi:MAG: Rieske (2Fe-2S) protein [Candidatus Dadabacteria bacterium]|nr:MAG: Rieske (2Fe-2S) protein [Candidatus Dadabacteria bacterium]
MGAKEVATRRGRDHARATLWSRRDFFGRLGWAGFWAVCVFALASAIRSAFPRVLFRPETTFKAGYPEDYVIGEVSERFKRQYRVWIIRTQEGIYALYAKCTHLGCTPRWLKAEQKFKCPCHGSGFYKSGINFEGPAPRPLERVRVTLADDGQILVDVSVRYRQEKGEWDRPGAILRV